MMVFTVLMWDVSTAGDEGLRLSDPRGIDIRVPHPSEENIPEGTGRTFPIADAGDVESTGAVYNRLVSTVDGRLRLRIELLSAQGAIPLELSATYDSSLGAASSPGAELRQSEELGHGWNLSYVETIQAVQDPQRGPSNGLVLFDGNGNRVEFAESTPGHFRLAGAHRSDHLAIVRIDPLTLRDSLAGGITKTYSRLSSTDTTWRLTRIENTLGQGVQVRYERGLVVSISTDVGLVLTFSRRDLPGGREMTIRSNFGPTVRLSTEGESLTTVNLGAGRAYRAVYETTTDGALLQSLDLENQQLFAVDYDRTARPSRVQSLRTASGSTTFDYDVVSRRTTVTDPAGELWLYDYDELGRTVRLTDPAGYAISRVLDPSGNTTAMTDANGGTWRYSYDTQGDLSSIADPLGHETLFTRNRAGRITAITAPRGNVTRFEYDARGQLTSQVSPTGERISLKYRGTGKLSEVRLAGGPAIRFGYDAAGRRSQYVDAAGLETAVVRDYLGRPSTIHAPSGATTLRKYDAWGNPSEVRSSDGRVETIQADALGRVAATTDFEGRRTTRAYDSAGRLAQVSEPEGVTTTYEYDSSDRLTAVGSADGSVKELRYDSRGLLAAVTEANGRATRYEYDGNRNVVWKWFPNGHGVHYVYDADNRVTQIGYPDGSSESFAYDENGNVISATTPTVTFVYSYDSANRLLYARNVTLDETVGYEYNQLGLRSALTLPDGRRMTYQYDTAARLVGIALGSDVARYSYNATTGRLEEVVEATGYRTRYAYDLRARLMRVERRSADGTATRTLEYAFDETGLPLRMTDSNGSTTFSYDALGRLVTASYPSGQNWRYGYDLRNNRVFASNGSVVTRMTYDEADQLTAVESRSGAHTYTYDWSGGPSIQYSVREIADGEGQIAEYLVDYQGRIVQETIRGEVHRFVYAPGGSSSLMEQHLMLDGGATQDYRYVLDGSNPLLEFSGSSDHPAIATPPLGTPVDISCVAATFVESDPAIVMERSAQSRYFNSIDSVRTHELSIGVPANASMLDWISSDMRSIRSHTEDQMIRASVSQLFDPVGHYRRPTAWNSTAQRSLTRTELSSVAWRFGTQNAFLRSSLYGFIDSGVGGSDPVTLSTSPAGQCGVGPLRGSGDGPSSIVAPDDCVRDGGLCGAACGGCVCNGNCDDEVPCGSGSGGVGGGAPETCADCQMACVITTGTSTYVGNTTKFVSSTQNTLCGGVTPDWSVHVGASAAPSSGTGNSFTTCWLSSGQGNVQMAYSGDDTCGNQFAAVAACIPEVLVADCYALISSGPSNACPNSFVSYQAVGEPVGRTFGWEQDGFLQPNQTSLFQTSFAPSGDHTVAVSYAGGCGGVCQTDTKTTHVYLPPTIAQQPQNANIYEGENVTFSVTATGDSLHFQWDQDGTPVGTDSATLALTSVSASLNGAHFRCTVSGPCTSTTSTSATLGVGTVTLTPSGTTKVLISKRPESGTYPSSQQTSDRTIRVRASISPAIAGKAVYLRVYDPDDLSSYETDSVGDDNHDPAMPRGDLHAAPGYSAVAGSAVADSNGNTIEIAVSTDAGGFADVDLTITNRYAGDNYSVAAAFAASPPATGKASGLLVAWKRVYVELDSMWKFGKDLTADFVPDAEAPGVPATADVLMLTDTADLQVGQVVTLFDAADPVGQNLSITALTSNSITVVDATDPSKDVSHGYRAGYPRSVGLGAAIARPSDGYYDLAPQLFGRTPNAYGAVADGSDGGTFVEFERYAPAGGSGESKVPFRAEFVSILNIYPFDDVWFDNANKSSVIHVVACSHLVAGDQTLGGADSDSNFQYIFMDEILHEFPSAAATVDADTSAHEFGHQFKLSLTDGSHPAGVLEHSGNDFCVMSYQRSRTDATTEFCLASPNHLTGVRDAIDPL